MSLKEQFGKDVLLTGWGHSRFGKLTDETLESLIVQVATEAIGNAGIEPGQIDEIYLGQFNSGMMPLAFPSSLALQVSEQLANVPSTRVENACASGSAAFQQGTKSLLAGTAKTVLVIGAEKMTHAGADVVGAALLGADYDMAGKASTTGFTGLFAEVAKHYGKRYGAGLEIPASEISATSWAPSRPRTTATAWTTPTPSSARTSARSSAARSRTRTRWWPIRCAAPTAPPCPTAPPPSCCLSRRPAGPLRRCVWRGSAKRTTSSPPNGATRQLSPRRARPGSGRWGWPASGLKTWTSPKCTTASPSPNCSCTRPWD